MCDELNADMIMVEAKKLQALEEEVRLNKSAWEYSNTVRKGLAKENEELRKAVEDLKSENALLRGENKDMADQIETLKGRSEQFYNETEQMRERCDAYEFVILAMTGYDPRE